MSADWKDSDDDDEDEEEGEAEDASIQNIKRSVAILVERGSPDLVPLCQVVQGVLRSELKAGNEAKNIHELAKKVGQEVLLKIARASLPPPSIEPYPEGSEPEDPFEEKDEDE